LKCREGIQARKAQMNFGDPKRLLFKISEKGI
jgi:hypothetical protein